MNGGDLNIVRAAELHTVADSGAARRGDAQSDTGVIEDGAVAIRDGVIRAVGTTAEVLAEWSDGAPEIDASGNVVLPGIVEAHCHPVFSDDRSGQYVDRLAGRPADITSEAGIVKTVRLTKAASDEELTWRVSDLLESLLASGVTTVEAKSGYGLDTDEELRHLRVIADAARGSAIDVVPVFLGAHMPPLGMSSEDYTALIEREMLPAAAEQGIAELHDVTVEEGLFTAEQGRRLIRAGHDLGMRTRVHADAFAHSEGWRVAVEEGALSVDHLTFTPDDEIRAMAGCDTVAVVLPVAELMYMTPTRANARLIRDSGIPLAVATDYCSSLGVLSTLTAMALAAPWYGLIPAEVVVGATLNAAYALGVAGDCGSLDAGKRGDVVLLDGPRLSNVFWRLATDGPAKVVKNGIVQ